jgi:pyruvate/2-oxoglutarate dehydrogenase complex dihydrolipoamide acyltransferase (E2) component
VIDNDGAATDYGYMHLRDKALVAEGEHVATGQPIGYVGDTGDADGCHLHFEIWTAPGWYAGGRPIDPLPSLKASTGAAARRGRPGQPASRRAPPVACAPMIDESAQIAPDAKPGCSRSSAPAPRSARASRSARTRSSTRAQWSARARASAPTS